MADDVLHIANCSGFYGDRFDAFREQLEGEHPVDVVTGDYLAELTMLILWRGQQKDPSTGYAKTFRRQFEDAIELVAERGVKVVVNAGGLNPSGLADATRELVANSNVDLRVAHIEGDDLLHRLEQLQEDGHEFTHLDTGAPLSSNDMPPLTANAYLGGWGIAAALEQGADVVIAPRVTDASLVVGPAAWRFGWERDDWDALAGAVVAGHVLECGAQATGGNYSFFQEVDGLEHPGFPIAEVHPDGSSVITKHPGTGGEVSVGTVTAQLLYEIGAPEYLNPDVTTDFGTIRLEQVGDDQVAITGVRGTPPTDQLKVCINTLGGFRNEMTFLLTGLDVDAKADLVQRTLEDQLPLDELDHAEWQLVRSDHDDADRNAEAIAQLRLVVKHSDPNRIGRRGFSGPVVEIALASYPGFTMTAPPDDADPFGVYWPALIPKDEVTEVVVGPDGNETQIAQTPGGNPARTEPPGAPHQPETTSEDSGGTSSVPLGRVVGARSGDKGGNANVGVWVRSADAYPWLRDFLTVDRFRELVPDAAELDVQRYELPNLNALNFVVVGLLGMGVSASTRIDPQAKGLGEYLRSRIVELPTDLV
ncbi:MAG: acyclic terpene utilization AtuA family protein [Nitriliruptorales bacterium]|nr:acyclic terpene utilization AtuA family protein [Nitriliruptorales bacterium]